MKRPRPTRDKLPSLEGLAGCFPVLLVRRQVDPLWLGTTEDGANDSRLTLLHDVRTSGPRWLELPTSHGRWKG